MATSKLRDWREARGLSARAFADLVQTSDASIIRIENGDQSPSADLMRRIHDATAGAVTPNDILAFAAPTEASASAN